MKKVKIYVNTKTSSAKANAYDCIIVKEGRSERLTQSSTEKDHNILLIDGVYACLKSLSLPSEILIYSKTDFPIRRLKKAGNGNLNVKNAELLLRVSQVINEGHHNASFYTDSRMVNEAFNLKYVEDTRAIIKQSNQFIFLDFEMLTGRRSNIISVGAVKRAVTLQYHGQFQQLIKPRGIYDVEERCYQLTGITKELIEREGIDFNLAMSKFLRWIGDVDNSCFITWGNFDYDRLTRDAKELRNGKLQPLLSRMIDFQRFVQLKHNLREQTSLEDMGKFYDLTNLYPHQALSDAIFLSKIYCAYRMQKHKQKDLTNWVIPGLKVS